VRYGVLADIHGNLPALEEALARLRRLGVDRYLVAGDLVGYGPFPNECVAAVAELGGTTVAGNHDLIALGRLSDERCIPLARRSLAWTREVLSDDSKAYLDGLPLRAEADGVVLAHGSLDDPAEYTLRAEQAAAQLARLEREAPNTRVLVLAHTHRRWISNGSSDGRPRRAAVLQLGTSPRWVINPGAVGQSRELEVRASFAILDLEALTATFEAVPYDTRRVRDELRRNGLDPRSYHLRPSPVRRARRLMRKLRS
jgi:predicted phosphodiesterase